MESLLKYFGEQGPQHGGNLFWSQNLPVPFRGAHAPTLTQNELETQVNVQFDFHAQLFDLSQDKDSDDVKKYLWVMDRVVNGLFVHHYIDRHVDHANGKVTVYIEWSQRYAQLSPQARAARSQGHAIPNVAQQPGPNPLAGLQHPSTGI